MHTNKFKAVLFDPGPTLTKTADPPVIFKRILEAHGVTAPIQALDKAHKRNQEHLNVEEMAEKGLDFWIGWNTKILQQVGIQENTHIIARKIDDLWFEHAELELYPDVMETLTNLKAKNVKMGIVTNGFERDFQNILKRLGLADFFEATVGADAYKKAKPHKEIFLYAVHKLQVRPEETLFIGDSISFDYEGARKAGLKPLLINRDGAAQAGVETITNLTEVLNCVG